MCEAGISDDEECNRTVAAVPPPRRGGTRDVLPDDGVGAALRMMLEPIASPAARSSMPSTFRVKGFQPFVRTLQL